MIGNILKKLLGNGDGLIKMVDGLIDTKAEKQERELKIKQFLHSKEIESERLSFDIEKEFNNRIKDLEGTASDLKDLGWVGKIILFLRGAFRPLVSYAMAYVDIMVFSKQWALPEDEQIVNTFWLINMVIFVFYFGERAIKNVAPLLATYLKK